MFLRCSAAERLGANWRFRIPYLRALALLAERDGHSAQAITHLREAARLADEIGLPEEQWQIQPVLRRAQSEASPVPQDRAEQQKR